MIFWRLNLARIDASDETPTRGKSGRIPHVGGWVTGQKGTGIAQDVENEGFVTLKQIVIIRSRSRGVNISVQILQSRPTCGE